MTPEELTELIRNGPTEAMITALRPLTEAERKKLSKTVINLRKELLPKEVGPFYHHNRPNLLRLKLALFAVGPATEVQRIRLWHLVSVWEHSAREVLFQVIRHSEIIPQWIPVF